MSCNDLIFTGSTSLAEDCNTAPTYILQHLWTSCNQWRCWNLRERWATFTFYTWRRTVVQQIEYFHVWCLSNFLAKLKVLAEEMSVSIAVRKTMFDLMFLNSGGIMKPQQIHRCQHSQKTNIGIHGCWLATIKELNNNAERIYMHGASMRSNENETCKLKLLPMW